MLLCDRCRREFAPADASHPDPAYRIGRVTVKVEMAGGAGRTSAGSSGAGAGPGQCTADLCTFCVQSLRQMVEKFLVEKVAK